MIVDPLTVSHFPYGVIHNVCMLRFCDFSLPAPPPPSPSPSPCTCTYVFGLHHPIPLVQAYRQYTANYYIFCELLPIKEPQTLQNEETTVQNYQKILNQNTKKSPEIKFMLFNCTGEMEIDNFGYQNSSLFCIPTLQQACKKRFYGACMLTATTPTPI